LLDKRLDNLYEIERIIDHAKILVDQKVNVRDTNSWDRADVTVEQLAKRRPEMLERIKEAKKIYSSLRQTHKNEASLR